MKWEQRECGRWACEFFADDALDVSLSGEIDEFDHDARWTIYVYSDGKETELLACNSASLADAQRGATAFARSMAQAIIAAAEAAE